MICSQTSFKRLVISINSMEGGGAERVTANLANHWAGKGWDITVVTLASLSQDFYDLHPSIKRIALNLVSDSNNAWAGLRNNLRRVIALRRILREIEPDVALAMMTTANVQLALAAWGLPKICAIGSEHVHPPKYPLSVLWEFLRRRTYGHLDAVTALTCESADWIKSHTGALRVLVIPNAVPWPLPVQEPKVSPESICPSGRKLLLATGRLATQKGFDLLVDAFTILALKYPDWDIVILGEGPLRTALQEQVRTARLGKRVSLPGLVGNVGEWYERADLYVMSSRFEGFGNTLAEALCYGLPAVSFDCDTGPRDIIRHEVDGLLVPPENVEGLIAAMDRLMGDASLRKKFSRRATEIRVRFSLQQVAGMWEELFEKVLAMSLKRTRLRK